MTWTVDLQNRAGGAVASSLPLSSLSVRWSLDGPGAFECNFGESDAASWLSGQRRVIVKLNTVTKWAGWLTGLSESTQSYDDLAKPRGTELRASALGLASILDRRVVHGDFSKVATVATTIAWNLIQHVQAQSDGDHGFTLGTITGSAASRTRDYCDGDNIAEAINELAALNPGGFDWDVSETGAFRAWVGGRGTASGETLVRTEAMNWDVSNETSDLVTYASALGEADEPCGAPLIIRSSSLVSTYGRLESVLESDTTLTAQLTELADEELRIRGAARIRLRATWLENRAPWAWGAVWLGDTLSVTLPAHFGGVTTMRVIEISVSVEPPAFGYIEYEFEAVG